MPSSVRMTGAVLTTLLSAMPLAAKTNVSPYLEVDQSVYAPLKGGGEVLSYSTIAAGVDVTATSNRVQAQVDYRIQRDFSWNRGGARDLTQSGIARLNYLLIPQTLSLEAGAIATRTRNDIRGNAFTNNLTNDNNLTQIYSVYAGPSLHTHAGSLDFNAAYQLGYTAAEQNRAVILPAGQPTLAAFDHEVTQNASASVGMKTGVLPFGWTVAGAFSRSDASELDQRLEQKHLRGDVVVPLTPTIAAVGGVGYEKISAALRPPLLTAAGQPVINNNGRYATNTASPRLPYYDFSGLYWDVGVLWRPTAHTSLEARVGKRFGSLSYTGSLSAQLSEATVIRVALFDEIDTFGSALNNDLAALPTSFQAVQNPFSGSYGGCVFGGANGTGGGCVNNSLQSLNSSVYRARGINALLSSHHGPWSYGVAGGYARHTYLTPATGALSALYGVADQNAFLQAYLARRLTPYSDFTTNLYANWYQSGIAGAPKVTSFGASGTYARSFGYHLSGTASLGLFTADEQTIAEIIAAEAQVGMRYRF